MDFQLINWVAEIETPNYRKRDWNRAGSLDDFIGPFADCISTGSMSPP